MRGKGSDEGISGAFEELPALLVVLVSVSLFSVSLAHAYGTWDSGRDAAALQGDCLDFARMVRNSDTLGYGGEGCYDLGKIVNFSAGDFLGEFNASRLGFQYMVHVQCIYVSGAPGPNLTVRTGDMPPTATAASFTTCVGMIYGDRTGAARLTVTIWRPS